MNEGAVNPGFIMQEQPVAERIMRTIVRRDDVSSAYLFYGGDGLGKDTLARWFVAALQCGCQDPVSRPCGDCSSCRKCAEQNHPDVHVLDRHDDRSTVSIDQIRNEVRPVLRRRAYEGGHKIILVPEAHRLTPEAQNAMLKSLEEPAGSTVVVLVSPSLRPLLPTVRSRCVRIPFHDLNYSTFRVRLQRDRQLSESDCRQLYLATAGNVELSEAIVHSEEESQRWKTIEQLAEELVEGTFPSPVEITEWAERLAPDRDAARDYLALLTVAMRGRLLRSAREGQFRFADCVDVISRMDEAIATNANARLALEVMFVKLRRILDSDYN